VEQLQVTATFPNIASENLATFKDLAAQALEITKGESGTLQYDWFFNHDETSCVVRETYESSAAVLTHIENLGALLGTLIELGGGLELKVFGSPSAQLLEAAAALQPSVYPFFQGK
jgi:quinol monooxygenase YgiN